MSDLHVRYLLSSDCVVFVACFEAKVLVCPFIFGVDAQVAIKITNLEVKIVYKLLCKIAALSFSVTSPSARLGGSMGG